MENNGCSAGPLDVVVRLRALDREGYQPLTGAIGEEAAAEIERLRQDTKRLDFLDWLMTRTEFQNRERPNVPVKSDMNLTDWGCALYARNLVGRIVGTGNGKTVREAIDVIRAANDLERATGVGGAVAETIQEQCKAIAREAGSDLRFGIGGAHEVTTNADITGLPPVGHPLHELDKHLAQYLDDDRFNECERLLLEGWDHDKIDRKTGQHAYTPMRPANCAGSYAASSNAPQAVSRNTRCCGSINAATRGFTPKKPASNCRHR